MLATAVDDLTAILNVTPIQRDVEAALYHRQATFQDKWDLLPRFAGLHTLIRFSR